MARNANILIGSVLCVLCLLFSALRKAYVQNSKLKGNLPESIIMDVFDGVCHGKGVFDTYGIREINNVKRLIGAGLPEANEPGMMQGGGKWPSRLHDMCDQFVGDLEEENIYAVFKKRPEDIQNFENYLCRGPETGLRGACSKLEGKRAKVEL
ncbi:marginal zone B- and B1-cell-specific protein-like isoform X2 [Lineus longissimus]|uniref:marginal zone B- and B1-cell-specific protein-like isoform X2 n=1 Tax=Lineus longissimus TaxID=88925 RepID=UPI00315D2996